MHVAVFLKHLFGCGVGTTLCALGFGIDLQPFKEHFAHLHGRAYVELTAREPVGLLLHLAQLRCVLSRQLGQCLDIDAHPCPLHLGKHLY